jgi:hypothetical protein
LLRDCIEARKPYLKTHFVSWRAVTSYRAKPFIVFGDSRSLTDFQAWRFRSQSGDLLWVRLFWNDGKTAKIRLFCKFADFKQANLPEI